MRWSKVALLFALTVSVAWTAGNTRITFTDVARQVGVNFLRVPSPRFQERQEIFDELPISISVFLTQVRPNYPLKPRGAPGVAIFDYDGDEDLDLFVTNGPGVPNSLYANQLREVGQLQFVDVGIQSGADATDQDSAGVCYGDIDNDGDPDLYVLGTGMANRLFENNGDGTFTDITHVAGVAGDGRHPASCSFGDIDNDGLLDIVVANTYDDWNHSLPIFVPSPTYPGMEHNYLFHNLGGNVFADVSASSGIENVANMSGPGLTGGSLTFAVAMVDYDLDGDVDILWGDNQGLSAGNPDEGRGWTRLYDNDGTGHFSEFTVAAGLDNDGSWMGLTFGDFNCDGNLDFFGTNLGDYVAFGARSTLFLGSATGTFAVGGPGHANVFGWGTSSLDYDNDGDADVIYHGGNDLLNIILADNPGVVYENQGSCSSNFIHDPDALTVDHRLRSVQGVATGDLNEDGFLDIVTVADHRIVPDSNYFPMTRISGMRGLPFDPIAMFEQVLTNAVVPGFFTQLNPSIELPDGDVTVELNSADSGNGWVKIETIGTVGITELGRANRDGIGAIVKFQPEGGPPSMAPVLGGASYASQDSLAAEFGLGAARTGTVEILWPGGVRNRLYDVRSSETLVFPEIPCSFADQSQPLGRYVRCVIRSLNDIQRAGILSRTQNTRFLTSALSAFRAEARRKGK